MSNRKYRHFFMYLNLCTFISLKWKGYPGMTNARCQHWDFNSVIENYISGMKLVCTVAYCLMTVINQPSSFQSRFLYSKLSYNVGSLGAILVVFTFLNVWQGSHLQVDGVSNVIFYCLNLKMPLSYSYHHVIKTFAWFCNWSESFHHVRNPFKLFWSFHHM